MDAICIFLGSSPAVEPVYARAAEEMGSERPTSPNCVNSQAKDPKHFIEPIQISGTSSEARNHILKLLKELNRSEIIAAENNYIRAEFSSRVFRFIDDVEFYFPDTTSATAIIHIRSASRLGYWDFGVNRKRIEQIRNRFKSIHNGVSE